MHRIFQGIANIFNRKDYLLPSLYGRGLGVGLFLFAWLGSSYAQTARQFTLVNSADGKSELTVYLPSEEALAKSNGRFIVDCPGGGYSHLAMKHEGHDWAEYYNKQGIGFAVLKYRMPNGDRNIPLSDAYNAIRTVRDSAKVWHVNPHNVGIQGFSAGGHLASAVSTHAPMNVRPDFAILFYPVISMNERLTHRGSCVGFLGEQRNDENIQKQWSSDKAVRRHMVPPTILIFSNDDKVVPPATNAVAYYSALRSAGANCSMFCYPTGGHGWGFRTFFKYHDLMIAELTQWLNDLKMPTASAVKVACVGNSITDGHGIDVSDLYGYPARLGSTLGDGYAVKNFGVSGRTLSNSGDYPYQKEEAWKRCLEWQPDVVVVKLGTNDTKTHNWKTAEGDIKSSMKTMVDTLRALPTNPRIIIAAPIPSFKNVWDIRDSVTVNAVIPQIQEFVKNENLEYLDLYNATKSLENFQKEYLLRDGVHPNEKGCQQIANLVAERIKSPVAPMGKRDRRIMKKKRK